VLDAVVLEPLVRLAGDENTDVQWSALWELAHNGLDSPEVQSALAAGAKSEAENVRAISLEGLARLDDIR
jgi:HEAT repeat protein